MCADYIYDDEIVIEEDFKEGIICEIPQIKVQSKACEVSIVKLPPFWKEDPELWFTQVEASFGIAQVYQDETKFHHVVANADPIIVPHIKDIIDNPPAIGKYDAIKKRILSTFPEDEEVKMYETLRKLKIGQQKPSHFLHVLKHEGGNQCSVDVLKSIFFEQMPERIRTILITCKQKDLTELAILADNLIDLDLTRQSLSIRKLKRTVNKQTVIVNSKLHTNQTFKPKTNSKITGKIKQKSNNKKIKELKNNCNKVDISMMINNHCYYHSPSVMSNSDDIEVLTITDSDEDVDTVTYDTRRHALIQNLKLSIQQHEQQIRNLTLCKKKKKKKSDKRTSIITTQMTQRIKSQSTHLKRISSSDESSLWGMSMDNMNETAATSRDNEDRYIHNDKERSRRWNIILQFEYLRLQVPFLENDFTATKIEILKKSARYVQSLQETYENNLEEIAMLKAKHRKLLSRLKQLEQEIKSKS